MELIFGTTNTAKISWLRGVLGGHGITVLGLEDVDSTKTRIAVDESGNTPRENARIKAVSYYKLLARPVFSADSGLYIRGLADEKQPGAHIRRHPDGFEMNDEQTIEYYARMAENHDGPMVAQYRNAVCLVIDENTMYEHDGDDIAIRPFIIAPKPHAMRTAGFPIDSLSVNIESGKYYFDIGKHENISSIENGFLTFFKRVIK